MRALLDGSKTQTRRVVKFPKWSAEWANPWSYTATASTSTRPCSLRHRGRARSASSALTSAARSAFLGMCSTAVTDDEARVEIDALLARIAALNAWLRSDGPFPDPER